MESITLAIVGSGGAGVVSLGELVLKAAASVGLHGIMRKSFGPQIRGGESAAIIRLSPTVVENFSDHIHYLFALDWNNFSRFGDEIPITPDTLVIQDTQAGPMPDLAEAAEKNFTLDFTGTSESAGSSKANMSLLGFIGRALGCTPEQISPFIRKRLVKLDSSLQDISVNAMSAGMDLTLSENESFKIDLQTSQTSANKPWIATGNQLAGLGALEAGVRFVAAYPITPASDCLEWVANHIESVGGHLVQAEDELSAINMIVGAGFAGVPSMTATSGPGLALMSEAMGLAITSETPTVVLNVMRGGPSTGIPTKSEQSDLNLAVYGMHGDAPHVVVSALSITDCFGTMAWAVKIASELQTLVIVLSDQFIGQSLQITDSLPDVPYQATLPSREPVEAGYARYLDTESGISPMAIPGVANGMYTADGLEHSEGAIPSPKASDHQTQLDKRARKLERYEFGSHWAELLGESDRLLLCWGSVYPVAKEAQSMLEQDGIKIKVVALRQLSPLPVDKLKELFATASSVLVVEQNHQAQFAHYLNSFDIEPPNLSVFAKPGPRLITPAEICDEIKSQIAAGGR